MRERQNKKRGMSIAVVLIIITIMMIIGMAIATIGSHNLSFSNKAMHDTEAFYAADAGISRAMGSLQSDFTWGTSTPYPTPIYSNVAMQGNANNTYTVYITNNFTGTTSVTGYNGVTVPAKSAYIYCEGKSSTGSGSSEIIKRVAAMTYLKDPVYAPMDAAVLGGSGIDTGNFDFNAFDSNTGEMKPGEADLHSNGNISLGPNAKVNGDVIAGPGCSVSGADADSVTGTVGTGTSTIDIPKVHAPNGSSSWLNGNILLAAAECLPAVENLFEFAQPQANQFEQIAMTDPDYRYRDMSSRKKPSPTPSPTSNPTQDPTSSPTDSPTPEPTTTMGDNYLEPGTMSDPMVVDSSDVIGKVLVGNGTGADGKKIPGIYVFEGNLSMSGQDTLYIDNSQGPVYVYLKGNASFSGNSNCGLNSISGQTIHPYDLVFFGECKENDSDTSYCSSISVTGKGTGSFMIYAPDATVTMGGNANIHGAIVANLINTNGNASGFLFDVLSRDTQYKVILEPAKVMMAYWRRY